MQNKYYNQADTTLGNFAPGGLAVQFPPFFHHFAVNTRARKIFIPLFCRKFSVQIPPDFRIGAMRLMYSMSRTN